MPETFTFEDAVQQPESFSFEDASQPESFSFEDAAPKELSDEEKLKAIQTGVGAAIDITGRTLGTLEAGGIAREAFAPEREKRAELKRQMEKARAGGKLAEQGLARTTALEAMVEPLTVPGMLNQPARALGYQDPFAPERSIFGFGEQQPSTQPISAPTLRVVGPYGVQPGSPRITIPEEGVAAGLGRIGSGLAKSFTTPEMAFTAPLAGPSQVIRALFAWGMAKALPEQVQHAYEVVSDPESTVADRIEAVGSPAVTAWFTKSILNHPVGPEFKPVERTGKSLDLQRGALPPRGEPTAPIERVTPEQAKLAAERMSAPFEGEVPKIEETTAVPETKAVEAEKINYRASVALEKAEQQKASESVLEPLRQEVIRTEKEAIAAEESEPEPTPTALPEGEQVVPPTPAAEIKTETEVAKVAEENNAPNIAKAEAEPVGMGGAVKGEFQPQAPVQSAIKNAAVDRDRVERGEPPMMDALRKGDPELWGQAMNIVDQDWSAADKLIARHKANPFIPTDVETMVLLHRRVDLKNEFNKANREAVRAEAEGRGEAAEAAKAVRDDMGEKLLELEAVIGKGDTAMGTMAGRAFRARQLVMNEDFSMAELVTNREAFLGRKLTREEVAQLQKISDENARLNAEYSALLDAHEKNQAARDMRKAVSDSEARTKQLPYHPRILDLAEGYAKKWDERGAQALADLKALFGGGEGPMFAGAPITPAMLDKAIIYGTSKIVRGAVDFAKWSDSMIRDLGLGFAAHAKSVWDASKKAFDSDVAQQFKKQGVATVQRVKGALKGAELGTETILKKIQRKVDESKGVLPDLKYYTDKLLDFYVRKGLKEEGPLLDAIHADLKKVIPDITRRETREILAGYGTPLKPLAKDTVSVIKRDMHGQWQEISKIDMIQRGIFPPKLQERATMTDKQRWLRKQYEEQKRLHPEVTPSDAEGQLKTAMQAAKTRITNQITDLEHQIQTRTKIVKESKKLKPDAELERLTAIRDEMRAVYDTVFKKPELTDAERLEIWKERTRDRIDELTEKVKNKQFQPKKRPDPIRLDPEAIKINFQLHKVHRALLDLRLKDQLDRRNTAQKVIGAAANMIRFSRAVITGGEFSAVLRQGAFTAFSHPIISAKALAPMFKALMSEEAQFKVMEEILTGENAPKYKRDKLELTETGMRLSNMEEHYMFRVSEKLRKIPGFGHLIKGTEAFQRAYTTFLNVIRTKTYDALVKIYGDDPKTGRDIANLINVSTGRGSVSLGKYATGLNTVLFAPRYSISRFQLLAGQPFWTAANKRMVVNEYAKALAGAATIYSLGMMAGGSVEVDPRSSDFGKVKFGNTRIDPLAGILQASVLLTRLATGKKKTAGGKIESLTGDKKFGKADIQELLSDFGFNKLAPLPSTAIKLRQGHDQIGQKYGMKDVLIDTVTPITYRDIYQTMKEQGVPEGTIMSVLAIFGMGVQNYEKQQKKQPNW